MKIALKLQVRHASEWIPGPLEQALGILRPKHQLLWKRPNFCCKEELSDLHCARPLQKLHPRRRSCRDCGSSGTTTSPGSSSDHVLFSTFQVPATFCLNHSYTKLIHCDPRKSTASWTWPSTVLTFLKVSIAQYLRLHQCRAEPEDFFSQTLHLRVPHQYWLERHHRPLTWKSSRHSTAQFQNQVLHEELHHKKKVGQTPPPRLPHRNSVQISLAAGSLQ